MVYALGTQFEVWQRRLWAAADALSGHALRYQRRRNFLRVYQLTTLPSLRKFSPWEWEPRSHATGD